MKIPFLTRLLEIKETQLYLEDKKINLLYEIRDGLINVNFILRKAPKEERRVIR